MLSFTTTAFADCLAYSLRSSSNWSFLPLPSPSSATVFLLDKAQQVSELLWGEDGGECHGEWMERDIEICSSLELEKFAHEAALLIWDKWCDGWGTGFQDHVK